MNRRQATNNMLDRTRVTTLLVAALCLGLGACKQPNAGQEIEAPQTWQAHLKPANLPPDFKPAFKQTVYVPIYSSIYYNNRTNKIDVAATLSVRNTDPKNTIIVKSIRYYDSSGKELKEFVEEPVALGPLATADVVVPRSNTEGGSGANFIVDWMSQEKPSMPLIEAVMVVLGSANNASFVSRGVTISETSEKSPPASHSEKMAPAVRR